MLGLLLGSETREAAELGYEVARIIGAKLAHGFITTAEIVAFVRELQGPYGLWGYAARPQASRWVAFDLLLSLLRLQGGEPEEWISTEPSTPFQPYPRRRRRY